jgi:hypothetical protein
MRLVCRLAALDNNLCGARGERVGSDVRNRLLGDNIRRLNSDWRFGNTRRFYDGRRLNGTRRFGSTRRFDDGRCFARHICRVSRERAGNWALDGNLCDARGERVGSDVRSRLLGDDTRRIGSAHVCTPVTL